MKRIGILILCGLIVSACRIEEAERKGPLHIVTTTGIIENGVEEIVGDSAEVSSLMGPGTDPHLYTPTPGDIKLLDDADVIVANGLHLEGKMAEMLIKYGKEKPVVLVSDGIPENLLRKSADFGDAYDPHIWFNPELWLMGLNHVKNQLMEIDTNAQQYYDKNFLNYQAAIHSMDGWVKSQVSEIDSTARVLITSHDAFAYFGLHYGIEVRGIQGISTLSEVGLKDIASMVDFVIEKKIPSIFIETSTSQKTAQSIVDGARAKGYQLNLKGPLYSDALGEPDGEAGTYIGMVKANVRMIVNGLSK